MRKYFFLAIGMCLVLGAKEVAAAERKVELPVLGKKVLQARCKQISGDANYRYYEGGLVSWRYIAEVADFLPENKRYSEIQLRFKNKSEEILAIIGGSSELKNLTFSNNATYAFCGIQYDHVEKIKALSLKLENISSLEN